MMMNTRLKVLTSLTMLIANNVALAQATVSPKAPALPNTNLLSLFLTLAFVIVLILAAAFIFRKLNHLQFKRNNVLQLVTGLSLGTRERVVLIQAGEKQILVGIAPGRLQTLHVFDEPITEPVTQSSTGFMQHLKAAMERGNN